MIYINNNDDNDNDNDNDNINDNINDNNVCLFNNKINNKYQYIGYI